MRRKKIALLTINPAEDTTQRILSGIFQQATPYNYDIVVISPMVHVTHYFKDYLHGELNIYEMINFDLFDGVVITPIPMQEEQRDFLTNYLLEKINKECHVPVVSINMKFGEFDVVYTNECAPMELITSHLIEKHNCRNLEVLTGPVDFPISLERVEGIRMAMEKHGMRLDPSKVHYGDFWYTSGKELGKKLLKSKEPLPDAVICCSDHMAIGLMDYFIAHGVHIPEDIIITGNGGSKEAALAEMPVTSFDADEVFLGKAAINRLHSLLDPNEENIPARPAGEENLCIGRTCGCAKMSPWLKKRIKDNMYFSFYDDSQIATGVGSSLSALWESYALESLISQNGIYECLCKIKETTFLLVPFGRFYLCLNDEWTDESKDRSDGYTDCMNLVINAKEPTLEDWYCNYIFYGKNKQVFDLKQMLPALEEEFDTPQVFYFMPIHFWEKSIGYAVLQYDQSSPARVGYMHRHYLRFLCSALEMCRAKDYVRNLSEHDMLTGLMNRRGMERWIREQDGEHSPNELSWFVMMVDMNDLKEINDTLGHEVGDDCLKLLANTIAECTRGDEIAVRTGGDEFLLIGVGEYEESDKVSRAEELRNKFAEIQSTRNLKRIATAAIGAVVQTRSWGTALADVMKEADVSMYTNKRMEKARRNAEQ